MLRVRAIKEGHFKYHRRPGDEFEIDGKHQLGKWMKIVPVESKPKAVAEPDEPKVKEKASPPEKPKAVAEPDSGEL